MRSPVIPLVALLALSGGLACKKPAPVVEKPKAEEVKPVAEDGAKLKAEADAKAEAQRKAEAEAAEAARKAAEEATRKAEAAKAEAFRQAAEAALKDVNFDFDRSSIREQDKAKLQAIADFLKANPQVKLQIEGHCDERGTVEYNLSLGERRAHSVLSYLVNLGVSQDRFSTISYGKERPKVQGHDEESYLANRRCEFKLQ